MTDTVSVALISGTFSFLAALIGILNNRQGRSNSRKMDAVVEQSNGQTRALLENKDALKDTAVDGAYHRGIIEGQRQEREAQTPKQNQP